MAALPSDVAAFDADDDALLALVAALLSEVAAFPGATELFNSSQIPGEIIDLMVVNSQTLEENPAFGKALVGAWYETMAIMQGSGEAAVAARTAMAAASGTDLAGFDAQLASTRMFWTPAEAVAFARSADLVQTMDKVRKFSNSKGLMGGDMESVGIAFPGGRTLGAKGAIKLHLLLDQGWRSFAPIVVATLTSFLFSLAAAISL